MILEEIGNPYEKEAVNLKTHVTASGGDFYNVTGKGAVPLLVLNDGTVLSEGVAILQYLADQNPGKKLAPENATLPRAKMQEWLNFVSTELHKGFAPIFKGAHWVQNAEGLAQLQKSADENLTKRYDYVSKHLEGKKFLLGDQYSVADAYLYTILTWAKAKGPKLDAWPNLLGFMERVTSRPATQKALADETAAKK